MKKGLLITFMSLCVVGLLLFGYFTDNDKSDQKQVTTNGGEPYLEVSPMDDVCLVGGVVSEWTQWNQSAMNLYNAYREKGRTYSSKPVVINWSVFNLDESRSVKEQTFELATDKDFNQVVNYTVKPNDRRISLNYKFVETKYYFRITATLDSGEVFSSHGEFKTDWSPRIIELGNLRNIRDIGGWSTTDGRRIRQGLVYRGCELDGATEPKYEISQPVADVMINTLGIKLDFDLRSSNLDGVKDALGDSVKHLNFSFLAYADCLTEHGKNELKEAFEVLADKENYPLYIHCTYGADRTGTICYFLEGLLGMSEEDCYREWELSTLQNGGGFFEEMEAFRATVNSWQGDTFQKKIEGFLLSIGVTEQEISNIKQLLLVDAPTE